MRMRSRRDILLRLKSRSMKEPRSLIRVSSPFFHFQSTPPPLSIRQAVFAKLVQRFTVLKHLWVKYYNNSSNMIIM